MSNREETDYPWCLGMCLGIAEGLPDWENVVEAGPAIKAVKNLRKERDRLLRALRAQAVLSDMQKETGVPDPADPRYTPFIGEWNGYHAPEQRFFDFADHRRALRTSAIRDIR